MHIKTIIIILILGILLNFLAFFSPLIFKAGGEFNTATGYSDIPIGYPLNFMRPDMSVEDNDMDGWRRPHRFHVLPFLVNLFLWTFVSAIIVFLVKKKH